MDVSVIIVNYNTRVLVLDCLKSIFKFTSSINFEVIVVDNDSKDGSCEAIRRNFPLVKLIESNDNLGFGKANNLGAKTAKGKYLLLLNSDCVLLENTIKGFFDFMETKNTNNSIGAVGAILLNKDLNPCYTHHKFPTFLTEIKSTFSVFIGRLSKKLFDHFEQRIIVQKLKKSDVECILGADIFTPRKVYDKLGGFDERFFLYFEETDLQKRMSDIGLKRLILLDQRIIHLGEGSSVKGTPSLKKWIRFNESRFKYCKKHWPSLKYRIFYLLMFPLLIYPIFLQKYPSNEKRQYLNMMLRKNTVV